MTVTSEQAASQREAAKEALSGTKTRLAQVSEGHDVYVKRADAEIEALCTAIGCQQLEIARLNYLCDQARLARVRSGVIDG